MRRNSQGTLTPGAMLTLAPARRTASAGRHSSATAARLGQAAEEYAWQRIGQARRQEGGFVAVKASSSATPPPSATVIAALDGVAPVNVTALFVRPSQGDRRRSRPAPLGIRARRRLGRRSASRQGRLRPPARHDLERLEAHVRCRRKAVLCSCTTPPRWPATRAAPTCWPGSR